MEIKCVNGNIIVITGEFERKIFILSHILRAATICVKSENQKWKIQNFGAQLKEVKIYIPVGKRSESIEALIITRIVQCVDLLISVTQPTVASALSGRGWRDASPV